MADGEILLTRLAAEALREHARLLQCRAIGVGSTRAVAEPRDDLLITFASRSSLRGWIGQRVLLVLETVLEGAGGIVWAARSTPVLCEMTGGYAVRADRNVQLQLPDIARTAGEWLEAQRLSKADAWAEEAVGLHDAFWATRRHRHQCIAAADHRPRAQLFQPGLFDLRAERIRAGQSIDSELQIAHPRKFIDAMSGPLESCPTRAALAIFPKAARERRPSRRS